jgi:hypothetical protein
MTLNLTFCAFETIDYVYGLYVAVEDADDHRLRL